VADPGSLEKWLIKLGVCACDDMYEVESCVMCRVAGVRCGPHDVRRLSTLEGSDGFHLSDAMFFCKRGMEVIYHVHCVVYTTLRVHVVYPCVDLVWLWSRAGRVHFTILTFERVARETS